jgi:flagellar basal-body rod protein FlgF
MLRGIATATAQLLAQSTRIDVLAANLAAVDTPGYRADRMTEQTFAALLLNRIDQSHNAVGTLEIGPVNSRPTVDLSAGPVEQTNRALDVAITGDGFFVVQAPDGVRYTRRGTFSQDSTGRLVSLEGWPVLGQQGPIAGPGPLQITPDGQVISRGRPIGRLRIVGFPRGTEFTRAGGTYLVPPPGTAGQQVASPGLLPGYLEGSNVDLTTTMTDLISASRSYEAAQRALTTQDNALGRLISAIDQS